MTKAPSPLPVGWSKVLDDIQTSLDAAIAQVDAREQTNHAVNDDVASRRHGEAATWDERLKRIGAIMDSAEQAVQSVDELLQKEETLLREKLAASVAARQNLTERASRAIG